MTDITTSIDRLRQAADTLITEGADASLVAAALTQVAKRATERDPSHARSHLENLAAILSTTAQTKRSRQLMAAIREALAEQPGKHSRHEQ